MGRANSTACRLAGAVTRNFGLLRPGPSRSGATQGAATVQARYRSRCGQNSSRQWPLSQNGLSQNGYGR
eukprot:9041336-Lingulodinium_polyedra.AAC.1